MPAKNFASAVPRPRQVIPAWVTEPVYVNSPSQVLKTLLAGVAWFMLMPFYVLVVSPYATMLSARSMAVGLAVFSLIAPHMWPSRTAPWRTVMLAAVASSFAGSLLLMLGFGAFALMGATFVGFAVVGLRMNSNGRKIVSLLRLWVSLRKESAHV